MGTKMKRIVSMLLAVVMILSIIPISALQIVAADNALDEVYINNVKLGNVYNMLGDVYLQDAVLMRVVDDISGLNAMLSTSNRSYGQYAYITSIEDYFENSVNNSNWDFGVGSEVNAKVKVAKVVELQLSQKYGHKFSKETTDSDSHMDYSQNDLMVLELIYELGTYSIDVNTGDQLNKLRSVLNEDFLNSLLMDDPEVFFATYGTHIITRYTAGGNGVVSYQGDISSVTDTSSMIKNTTYSRGYEGTITIAGGIEKTIGSESTDTSYDNVVRAESKAYGGNANGFMLWDSASVREWGKSITAENAALIVDNSLKMIPVWTLLNENKYASRRVELEQYFNENVDAQYAEVYGKYIYSPDENKDYSDYTFIQTPEDLNNIRNNLDGKYVLLNNIDISGYSEWEPIGTSETPFSGIIDGNGNTIDGLNITKCNTYAGLIGYNKGTIENLTVSGKIDADASGSTNDLAYIGGIAGYNAGTITKCRNMVSINGKITVTNVGSANNAETTNDFFTKYSTAIENAKKATAQTLSNNSTWQVGLVPIRLTGTATGVTINVTGSATNDPAFIVLENANFSGTIKHSDDRPICIISIGESNSITGLTGTIAVNTANSKLYICGESNLSITGGKGKNGVNYSTTNSINAETGSSAISASYLATALSGELLLCGGDGGAGGIGAQGSQGSTGAKEDIPFGTNGNAGGTGGTGKTGGTGGNGGLPVVISNQNEFDLEIFNGTVSLIGGKGGNGGKGGKGGTGGTGGKNAGAWGVGGPGGTGGTGGTGGKAGIPGNSGIDSDRIMVHGESIIQYYNKGIGTPGAGGDAGAGGTGGEGVSSSDSYRGDSGGPGQPGTSGGVSAGKVDENFLMNLVRKYTLFTVQKTWKDAEKAAQSVNAQLVSIGSSDEQKLVEKLITISAATDNCFWIGLKTTEFGTDYAVLEWCDGSKIRIMRENGITVSSHRIDHSGNVIADAYVNWANGEPNNANNQEMYTHFSSNYKWNDNSEYVSFGYITEEVTHNSIMNPSDLNALFVGGICGYNAGTVKSAYNTAKVSVNKAYSLQSGISAYSGGISGYNNGSISNSTNTGDITALAVSDSMSYYADAYAYNIGKGVESTSCSGYVNPSPIAYSANSLENYQDNKDVPTHSKDDQDSTKAEIESYWKNSNLVINSVNKTEYLAEEEFDNTSLNISFGNNIISSYTVRYNFYKPGTSTTTIVYTDGDNSYYRYIPVRVLEKTPEYVEIYMTPKTEYVLGEGFSAEGLALKLVYNNGSQKLLSSKVLSVSEANMSLIGEQTITVSYYYNDVDRLTCTYNINVSPIKVVGIQITSLPEKTTYSQGESINLAGMKVQKVFNNGVAEDISLDELTLHYDFSTIGTSIVTVAYGEETYGEAIATATFECTIKKIDLSIAPCIEVKNATIIQGGTVTVDVILKNNPGFAGLNLYITYSDNLTLLSVDNKIPLTFTNDATLLWDGTTDYTEDGTLMTLTFDVADTAAVGDYDISLHFIESANANQDSITFYCVKGTIRVLDFVYGDADGDGVVNTKDIVLLRQYVAGKNPITGVSSVSVEAGADANADGVVNTMDIILVRQYVAGRNPITGESSVVLGPREQ